MDDDDNPIEITDELATFLEGPASRMDLVLLVQPLRSAALTLFGASMNSLALHIHELPDGESRSKAVKSFDELSNIFEAIDKFDERIGMLLRGMEIQDKKQEATHD